MLKGWRAMNEQRDDLVREAHKAGISVMRIHQLSGIARTTIDRILASKEGA